MFDVELYIKIYFIYKIIFFNIYRYCKRCVKILKCFVFVSI